MTVPIHEFGGEGPPLVLSVANGFPPQTYHPLLAPLTDRLRVVAVLPRALWPDAPPPESFDSWHEGTDDLLTAMDEHGLHGAIAVGHSMGGVMSLLAAIQQPEGFRALILLDPTLLDPRLMFLVRLMAALGQRDKFPTAVRARKRRAHFRSVDAAYEHWRGKPLFADWPDATLRLYAESMLTPAPDGDGVVLRWTPAWEAQYFATIPPRIWGEVRALRPLAERLPMLFLQGVETDAYTAPSFHKMRRMLPGATHTQLPGHGHLFPHSAPGETRRLMLEWLHSHALLP